MNIAISVILTTICLQIIYDSFSVTEISVEMSNIIKKLTVDCSYCRR